MTDKKKKRSYTLKDIPDDIFEVLIDTQATIKKKCNCNYSREQVIYKFIRCNKNLLDQHGNLPDII